MDKLNLNEFYVLNPCYFIRGDKNRAIVINKNNSSSPILMHPVFGSLLMFFSGVSTLKEIILSISKHFSITKQEVLSILSPLIENHKEIKIRYDGEIFIFPPNLIVVNSKRIKRNDLNQEQIEQLEYPYDFSSLRLAIPNTLLFVLNTTCVTDCIYCYADKKTEYKPLSLKRIYQIIDEAKEIGITEFDLSGGEVLLHSNWESILGKLLINGFNPLISTKAPISKEICKKLCFLGVKHIQISLDTINQCALQKTLNVNSNYIDLMLSGLDSLNRHGIEITIKPTLTKLTCTTKNIDDLLSGLKKFNNIRELIITVMGYSHYQSTDQFHAIRPKIKQVKEVADYIETLKHNFPIRMDNMAILESGHTNYSKFKNRSFCTANTEGIVVLPDGKVTICEELYWNEDFLIGDLTKETIIETWNSKKAKSLWKLSQDIIPENSSCKQCQEFIDCRQGLGVCWKDVISAYGKRNMFFPDPRCPIAPDPIFKNYYFD